MKQIIDSHVHSYYSLLDGVSSPTSNVQRAKDLGMEGVGITDHGVVAGIFEHYWACKEKGIKPLLGCELYLTNAISDKTTHYFHGIIIAMNKVGLKNLIYLSSLANSTKHYKYARPCIEFRELFEHAEGLIFSTGCMVGIVGTTQKKRRALDKAPKGAEEEDAEYSEWERGPWDLNEVRALFGQFKEKFEGRMFVEVGPARIDHDWLKEENYENEIVDGQVKRVKKVTWGHKQRGGPDACLQTLHNQRAIQLANEFGLPLIIASDAHMCHPALKNVQDILIKNAITNHNGWHFHQTHAMLSTEEVWAMVQKQHPYIGQALFEEMVENTHKLSSMVENMELEFPAMVPKYLKLPAGVTPRQELGRLIEESIKSGRIPKDVQYLRRLQEEIAVICDNGLVDYSDYFLILADLVRAAKEREIGVGPARGSAGGCLLAFALGITSIDPIKYNLSFVRFLNAGRLKGGHPPDIDMDFTDRDPIVEYILGTHEKPGVYGPDRAAAVGAYQTIKTKQALKDIVRSGFGGHLPTGHEVYKICEGIETAPQYYPSEEDFLNGFVDDDGKRHPGLLESNKELAHYLKDNPLIHEQLLQILGTPRHLTRHAGGVVITPGLIDEIIPTKWWQYRKHTQVDFKTLEKIGGLKIDILGVNTLNYIWNTVKKIKSRRGLELDPWNLPIDRASFDLLKEGNTSTVFQFDTQVVRPFLSKIGPKSINDLILITSVARPGCLDSTLEDGQSVADHFERRATGGEPVDILDPILEPILGETYGLVIFQEQIQKIFEVVGGLSPIESDDARRAVGKKNLQVLIGIKKQLFEGAKIRHGWSPKKCEALWDSFIGAANYAFNKAHATAYAIIAYACAYLKQNYPLEWWCSVLSAVDTDKIKAYLPEIRDIISLPSINHPGKVWDIDANGKLVPPLTLIKAIGDTAVAEIGAHLPYLSFSDFFGKVDKHKVNKVVMTNLIKAGCFIGVPIRAGETVSADYDDVAAVLEEMYKLRKESKVYAELNLDRAQLVVHRSQLLAIASYDYVGLFADVLQSSHDGRKPTCDLCKGIGKLPNGDPCPKRDWDYKFEGGRHWIDECAVFPDSDEFEKLNDINYPHPIAFVGLFRSESKIFYYKDKKSGKKVGAYRLLVENGSKLVETVIWPNELKKADKKDFEEGALLVVFGTVAYSQYKRSVELRYAGHKRLL